MDIEHNPDGTLVFICACGHPASDHVGPGKCEMFRCTACSCPAFTFRYPDMDYEPETECVDYD